MQLLWLWFKLSSHQSKSILIFCFTFCNCSSFYYSLRSAQILHLFLAVISRSKHLWLSHTSTYLAVSQKWPSYQCSLSFLITACVFNYTSRKVFFNVYKISPKIHNSFCLHQKINRNYWRAMDKQTGLIVWSMEHYYSQYSVFLLTNSSESRHCKFKLLPTRQAIHNSIKVMSVSIIAKLFKEMLEWANYWTQSTAILL